MTAHNDTISHYRHVIWASWRMESWFVFQTNNNDKFQPPHYENRFHVIPLPVLSYDGEWHCCSSNHQLVCNIGISHLFYSVDSRHQLSVKRDRWISQQWASNVECVFMPWGYMTGGLWCVYCDKQLIYLFMDLTHFTREFVDWFEDVPPLPSNRCTFSVLENLLPHRDCNKMAVFSRRYIQRLLTCLYFDRNCTAFCSEGSHWQ